MKSLLQMIVLINCFVFYSCSGKKEDPKDKYSSNEWITRGSQQDSLFMQLVDLTQHSVNEKQTADSLSFLVLPVEAACPSCRRKTIDSIQKYQHILPPNHFVVISGTSFKTIRAFFKEQDQSVPSAEGRIFIDSTNEAFIQDLVYTKPVIYYAAGKKVYRKVSSKPFTIKHDLKEFFAPANNTLITRIN